MDNPFEIIDTRLSRIENLLIELNALAGAHESNPEIILSVQQTADLIRLSVQTVYGYVSRNEIPYSKKGGRLYFLKSEIIEWIKEGRRMTHTEIKAQAHTYLKQRKRKNL